MNTVHRILALAKERGVKQSHLEEVIGGYRGKTTEWKNGKSTPTVDEINALAAFFSVSAEYLTGTSDMPCQPDQPSEPQHDEWELLAAHYDGLDPDIAQKVSEIARHGIAQNAAVSKPYPEQTIDATGLTPEEIAEVKHYIEFLKAKRPLPE